MRILRACRYSMDGLAAAFRHEAAFRQLLALAAVLIPVALWLPVGRLEKAVLIGSVLLSLVIELLNSAIEAAVDRISNDPHPLSKRAKDLGSAAQMMGLVNIGAVWAIILWDRIPL
jgi:diacylglycerol kinase (ATP)